jgi:hypothetical protein
MHVSSVNASPRLEPGSYRGHTMSGSSQQQNRVKAAQRPAERRLVLVVSLVVFVDTMFYAVIAPLLPGLAHSLHLS